MTAPSGDNKQEVPEMDGATWGGGERERSSREVIYTLAGCTSAEAPQQKVAVGHEQVQSTSLKPLDFLADMRARNQLFSQREQRRAAHRLPSELSHLQPGVGAAHWFPILKCLEDVSRNV